MKNKKIWLGIIIITLLLIVTSFIFQQNEDEKNTPSAGKSQIPQKQEIETPEKKAINVPLKEKPAESLEGDSPHQRGVEPLKGPQLN
jgi:hypothetical protein